MGIMPKSKNRSFEHSLETLEQLVKKMDSGDLSLEESLASFEQGIQLVRQCQQQLQQAEQKVHELLGNNEDLQLQVLNNAKGDTASSATLFSDFEDDTP